MSTPEALRDELMDWLRANKIDPANVPHGTVPKIVDGRIVHRAFMLDDGRRFVSPVEPNTVAVGHADVPLLVEPSPRVLQWLRGNDPEHSAAWLVWSNQRGMWWRADERGYTSFLHEAGQYTRDRAEAIVAKASCEGQLVRTRVDPVTGKEHKFLDEVMILAPERLK